MLLAFPSLLAEQLGLHCSPSLCKCVAQKTTSGPHQGCMLAASKVVREKFLYLPVVYGTVSNTDMHTTDNMTVILVIIQFNFCKAPIVHTLVSQINHTSENPQ